MRARRVVVAEIIAKTATQVSLVYNNHVIEELAADRTDQALGKGILPGRARCRENLADAEALDTSPKLAAVNAVAITEEKARGFFMRGVCTRGVHNQPRISPTLIESHG